MLWHSLSHGYVSTRFARDGCSAQRNRATAKRRSPFFRLQKAGLKPGMDSNIHDRSIWRFTWLYLESQMTIVRIIDVAYSVVLAHIGSLLIRCKNVPSSHTTLRLINYPTTCRSSRLTGTNSETQISLWHPLKCYWHHLAVS